MHRKKRSRLLFSTVGAGVATLVLLLVNSGPALAAPSLRAASSASADRVATSPATVTAPPFTGGWLNVLIDTAPSTETIVQVNATGNGSTLSLLYFTAGDLSGHTLILGTPDGSALTSGVLYSTRHGVTITDGERCSGSFELDALSPPTPLGYVTEVGAVVDATCGYTALAGKIALNLPNDGGHGYYLFQQDGWLTSFGNDSYLTYLGEPSALTLNGPIVAMATTPDGGGYWMLGSDGGIFAYGDAGFYGSMGGRPLNAPVVGLAATPTGRGYYEVASDGGLFAFGNARFYGSMGGKPLNKPIVGITATPTGHGYWEVASDGGLFAFGNAQFYGSMGGKPLNKPIVGMAATATGMGYWEVASDGGVFAFGNAQFYGSTGNLTLNKPIEGIVSTTDGGGYWFVASDGGVFAFGDAPFYGSAYGRIGPFTPGGTPGTDTVGIVHS